MSTKKISIPKWQRKLNAAERKHLRETCDRVTLKAFKKNFEGQQQEGIVCWDCRSIARKLGIEIPSLSDHQSPLASQEA